MSIHAELSQEAKGRLAKQQRNSTIALGIISTLVIAVIALGLGFFLLDNILKEPPTLVTYKATSLEEDTEEKKKVNTQIQRKPSAPSASSARVIATSTPAETSIPVIDVPVNQESVEFGDGEEFGEGWGDGIGFGTGGGGASFFNQSVQASRIAYVIDYSLSMKGERDVLMREELTKSVAGLKPGMNYQMVYFSGPGWVAGSELPGFNYGSGKAIVKGKGGRTYEWTGKGLHDWKPKGKRQPVEWIEVTSGNLAESLDIIKETKLSGGTDWEVPLRMVFDMEPPPQIVFFMTDGAVGGKDMMKLTDDLAKHAVKNRIVVNTVAMMEPKAEAPMANLAEKTGGEFTVIGKDGKPKSGGKGKKKK